MWLLELVLLSLVLGVPLGIGLHVFDKWREGAEARKKQSKTLQVVSSNKS